MLNNVEDRRRRNRKSSGYFTYGVGSAGVLRKTRILVRRKCIDDLNNPTTANSSLYTTRARSLRPDNEPRSSSKRERASLIVGRFDGSLWTMSSINGCMNSNPCAACECDAVSVARNSTVTRSGAYLEEVGSNQVPQVVYVRPERVLGLVRALKLWHRFVPTDDDVFQRSIVVRRIPARDAEIDVVVLDWSFCPGEFANASFEIVTLPLLDGMRDF